MFPESKFGRDVSQDMYAYTQSGLRQEGDHGLPPAKEGSGAANMPQLHAGFLGERNEENLMREVGILKERDKALKTDFTSIACFQ